MTDMSRQTTRITAGAGRRGGAPTAPARGWRVLAAVDDSQSTGRVVNTLLQLHDRQALHVIVLNIQPEPTAWRQRGYGWFHREQIRDRLVNDLGRRVLASVAGHLDPAGIPHEDRVEVGDPLETLLRCAREENCDLIVLAEPDPGAIQRRLLRTVRLSIGSVAGTLVRLAPVPVLVAR